MRAVAALAVVLSLVANPALAQEPPPDELADEMLASPLDDPDQSAPPPPAPLDDSERAAADKPSDPADPSEEGGLPVPADPAGQERDEELDEDRDAPPSADDGYAYEREGTQKGRKGKQRRGDRERSDPEAEGGPPLAGASPLMAGLASSGGAALGLVLPMVLLAASGATGFAVSALLQSVAPQVAGLGAIFLIPVYGAPIFLLLGLATGGFLGALPFVTWWKGLIAGGAAALVAVLVYFVGAIVGALVGGLVGGVVGFAYLATLPTGSFTGLEFLVPLFLIAGGIAIGAMAGPLLTAPSGVLTAVTITYISATDEGYE